MSWNEERSRQRIAKLLSAVPEGDIKVENFATEYRARRAVEARLSGKAALPGIDGLPFNAVIVTDGVHVYANLLDYDIFLEEIGRETEAGSRLVLEFLHLHYSGMDRLIEAFGAQRVDHHGGRVHAVVLEPAGEAQEAERIDTALALAAAMRALVNEASAAHQRRYGSRIRVGVESGVALAVNSGRRGEPEPLFIGDAANLAAKLADGEAEGVAVGPRARQILATAPTRQVNDHNLLLDEASYVQKASAASVYGAAAGKNRIDDAFTQFRAVELAQVGSPARFAFFRHDLPLRTIDFATLSPSRSARQESASLFADLSGFTAYVHDGMASGKVRQIVSNLHVLRGEMAAVLRDFGGRKIRFIGDCIQGVLAEGDQHQTNDLMTVRQAVECAGALRSSFELCQRLLPGIERLGLTIGIELGSTPVTRLGIRGDRSVRCASSRAVTVSERVQGDCGYNETALGPNALRRASATIRHAFGVQGRLSALNHAAAAAFVAALTAPAIARASPVPAQSHAR